MARKKPIPKPEGPMGPKLAETAIRLGFYEKTVKVAEIARLVTLKTGKPMSRQRISAIFRADRVEDETLVMLAKAMGIKVTELFGPTETKP